MNAMGCIELPQVVLHKPLSQSAMMPCQKVLMPRVAMTALSHMQRVYCSAVCPWQQEKFICVTGALSSIGQTSWWHQTVPATWYSVFCPQSASCLLQCSCASIGYHHTARQ